MQKQDFIQRKALEEHFHRPFTVSLDSKQFMARTYRKFRRMRS